MEANRKTCIAVRSASVHQAADHVPLRPALAATAELYPCRGTFEFDDKHVSINQSQWSFCRVIVLKAVAWKQINLKLFIIPGYFAELAISPFVFL